MVNIEQFFDEIDTNRSRRVRELSEVKLRFSSATDPFGIESKAVVVLTYAHWEGFYNDCIKSYTDFLKFNGGKVRDQDWMMLTGVLTSHFQSLYDRNHSHDARRHFIENLKEIIECDYETFDTEVVEARSNLDFAKLHGNYHILGFDISKIRRYRLKIDHEVVAWRHQVAHGDQPDLSLLDIQEHVDLVASLMLIVADQFQEAMLIRLL